MLKKVLGAVWQGAPKSVRRWSVWLIEPRFAVTAGAVVLDERGRVLLLNHVFRKGSGWGLPGGFLNTGEQPEEGLRRELREEMGMELDEVALVFVRTFKRPRQLEIIYRCRAHAAGAHAQSLEIKSAAWFELDQLPPELKRDQRHLIERALATPRPEPATHSPSSSTAA